MLFSVISYSTASCLFSKKQSGRATFVFILFIFQTHNPGLNNVHDPYQCFKLAIKIKMLHWKSQRWHRDKSVLSTRNSFSLSLTFSFNRVLFTHLRTNTTFIINLTWVSAPDASCSIKIWNHPLADAYSDFYQAQCHDSKVLFLGA